MLVGLKWYKKSQNLQSWIVVIWSVAIPGGKRSILAEPAVEISERKESSFRQLGRNSITELVLLGRNPSSVVKQSRSLIWRTKCCRDIWPDYVSRNSKVDLTYQNAKHSSIQALDLHK